jgi:hypothetical protein
MVGQLTRDYTAHNPRGLSSAYSHTVSRLCWYCPLQVNMSWEQLLLVWEDIFIRRQQDAECLILSTFAQQNDNTVGNNYTWRLQLHETSYQRREGWAQVISTCNRQPQNEMAVFWVVRFVVDVSEDVRVMTLMMETVSSSETSVNIYHTTRYYVPANSHLLTRRPEIMKYQQHQDSLELYGFRYRCLLVWRRHDGSYLQDYTASQNRHSHHIPRRINLKSQDNTSVIFFRRK